MTQRTLHTLRGVHSMLTMKELASFEKQGGGSGKRCALPESGGGEVCILQWKIYNSVGSGEVLLHYSRGGWTPLGGVWAGTCPSASNATTSL
jgi:hypothetical protein